MGKNLFRDVGYGVEVLHFPGWDIVMNLIFSLPSTQTNNLF
ncbi:hypothetical protein B6N60_01040 [Richelia sinica FACHB-800]|uniref:Uncharacterized protein n=1 Tax=Richelia sinica FACHB-800 TaxID=1357546 RepID=A0A975T570_9NOST|nr:hypothetical protein B6N60_01040 [Richelia sinica FACHB-800]